MSYIVLARKWRPRGFDDLVGQESVARTLRNALASEKVAHAYLFSGPRGVGKTSSARILAKALNCEQAAGSDPCGECTSCRAITDGASVDVFEIDGASNNSVEAVRELRETVKYAPSGGRYKIYIIDEVHMLSTSAFNALLKTLEEPPPHVVFIFATTEPKKIPSTILSRCQHYSFRRITRAMIREQLKKITAAEKINITEGALQMISKAADGSMRDALTLLDQACSFTDDITEKELQGLLGLPETEIITSLSKNILTGNIPDTLSLIKELTDRGSDLRQLTRELVEYFRNIAVVKVTRNPEELLEFSTEEVQGLRELASDAGIEELTLLLSELLRLEGEVRSAVNPRYTLELGLLRMSFVKGMTSIGSILQMLGDSGAPGEKKTEVREQQPEPPARPHIRDKEGIWKQLLERLDTEDHLLACKLMEAAPLELTASELAIGFNGGMTVLADFIKGKASVINPLLQEISGRSLRLKILSLPGEKAEKDNKKIKEEVFSEPLVREALKIFSGSLIKVKSLE
ncbi:MAG: DNA polymerase III subunit gamma/tau [Deferribacteres bacterium]|nr:DNA polymerase III subunit gamma/tau [Deferribacteres bacterium]